MSGTKNTASTGIKPRSKSKGKKTAEKIISVARDLLVEEGYESFVVREIASRAGVQPGNLQYYFANKKELLRAVLQPELGRYQQTYSSVTEDKFGKTETILAVVDFLLEEIKQKSTCNIWYTVWALAPQEPDIAELMDEWYEQYMQELKSVIMSANPSLSEKRAGHIASLLTAIMDGLTNQIGYNKERQDIHDGIESTVRTLFLDLVD